MYIGCFKHASWVITYFVNSGHNSGLQETEKVSHFLVIVCVVARMFKSINRKQNKDCSFKFQFWNAMPITTSSLNDFSV